LIDSSIGMERPKHDRLLDYYFVVTANQQSIEQIKKRLSKTVSLASKGISRPCQASFTFKPKIVDRYPRVNHQDTPLLPWVARACLPTGVRVRTKPPAPRFSTFVGWNELGEKLYGACLLIFEKLPLSNQNQPVYMPKALALLSHYPLFYAFEVFLRCLWHSIPRQIITLEVLLVHYFYDIPAPSLGKKIAYDLGKMKVLLAQRSVYDLPVLELSVSVLFQRLSVPNIVLVLKLLLLGHQVILVASHETELTTVAESELTAVAETLTSFIFPLKWNHLYIPILSRSVAEKLTEYSGPFLVGLPAHLLKRPDRAKLPKRAIVVDLERNEIRHAITDCVVSNGHRAPPWPPGRQLKLTEILEDAAKVFTNDNRTRKQTYKSLKKIFNFITLLLRDAQQAGRSVPTEANSFCKRLRETHIFKDFCLYYHNARADKTGSQDRRLEKVFQFFMDHEELGQDFGKPQPVMSTLSGTAFDVKEFDTPFQTVDDDLIGREEKKKRRPRIAKQRRRKPPYIADISVEAQKFVNKYLLAPRVSEGRKRDSGSGSYRKGTTPHRAMYHNRFREASNSLKVRPKHHSVVRPKSLDLSEIDNEANQVSNWLQKVVDESMLLERDGRLRGEREQDCQELITDLSRVIRQVDSVVKSRRRQFSGEGFKNILALVQSLRNASCKVQMAQEGRISVDRALRDINNIMSNAGDLQDVFRMRETSHHISMYSQIQKLTPEQLRRIRDDEMSVEGFSDNEDEDSASYEDWDAEDTNRSSNESFRELHVPIGKGGYPQHERGSAVHMTELPANVMDDLDTTNDRQYPPLNEFHVSREEEDFWNKCEIVNSGNVGKNEVIMPMCMDYFSDSIMRAWVTRTGII